MAGLNTEWLMLEKKAITIRFAFQDILEIGLETRYAHGGGFRDIA